jgi:TPR repeat protein
MMNSFYWTQSLLVVLVAILAFFISFGPSQNRAKWLTYLGIAASVGLFVANQVVMSNTGDGLDKQLNCWIWPTGVACPKPHPTNSIEVPDAATPAVSEEPQMSASVASRQGRIALASKDFVKARAYFEKACSLGEGCYKLGEMVSNGQGGKTDEIRGRLLMNKGIDLLVYSAGCKSGEQISCDRFYQRLDEE